MTTNLMAQKIGHVFILSALEPRVRNPSGSDPSEAPGDNWFFASSSFWWLHCSHLCFCDPLPIGHFPTIFCLSPSASLLKRMLIIRFRIHLEIQDHFPISTSFLYICKDLFISK